VLTIAPGPQEIAADILVEDGRIAAMGAGIAAEAEVIDAGEPAGVRRHPPARLADPVAHRRHRLEPGRLLPRRAPELS
jgi:hypothetical protein